MKLKTTRRHFLRVSALGLGSVAVARVFPAVAFAASPSPKEKIMTTMTLPQLPYAMDALSPAMSAETLEYHHGKHHKAYVDKGNELIEKAGMQGKTIEEIIKASHGKAEHAALFNNVAQHWNHVHFWQWMQPNGGGTKMPGNIDPALTKAFGGFNAFREQFIAAGMGQFGSGWAWLVTDDAGTLSILKTPNGENPLHHGKHAVLGVDVWEHSYYIDYRNARQKYLETFVDRLVNWEYASALYAQATGKKAAA